MISKEEAEEAFLKRHKKRKRVVRHEWAAYGTCLSSYATIESIPNITKEVYEECVTVLIHFYGEIREYENALAETTIESNKTPENENKSNTSIKEEKIMPGKSTDLVNDLPISTTTTSDIPPTSRKQIESMTKSLSNKNSLDPQVKVAFHIIPEKFHSIKEPQTEKEIKTFSKKELVKEDCMNYFFINMPLNILDLMKDHIEDYEDYYFNDQIKRKVEENNIKELPEYSGVNKLVQRLKTIAKRKLLSTDFKKDLILCYDKIYSIEENEKKYEDYPDSIKSLWLETLKTNYVILFPLIEIATIFYFKMKFKEYLQEVYENSGKGLLSHATYAFITRTYLPQLQNALVFKIFITNFEHLKNYRLDDHYFLSMNDKHRLFKLLVCLKVYNRILLKHNLQFDYAGRLMDSSNMPPEYQSQQQRNILLERYFFQEGRNYYHKFWKFEGKRATSDKEYYNYITDELHSKFFKPY